MCSYLGGTNVHPWFGDPKWVPGEYGRAPGDSDGIDRGRKVKILVVDDESVIAETVVEILKQEGFDAMAASNSSAAIELASSWTPDIVLSDVIMPHVNGIEMGIKIRESVPDCKIILFSGQAATVDLLEQAREQGHRFEMLAKPIRPDHLVAIIRANAKVRP